MRVNVDEAVRILNEGGNVAIPTETVYGLAALYHHSSAIDRIFKLKGRPRDNPLIIHVADQQSVEALASPLPKSFFALVEAFWPGPLALALEVDQNKVLDSVRARLPKACFRMPAHPLALEVIQRSGPLVMPSANLSGKPSPTDYLSVVEDLGEAFPVVDGGHCVKGVESTILIFDEERWHLGRLGSLTVEEIMPVLGYRPEMKIHSEKAQCPGQRWRHYAPKAVLNADKKPPSDIGAIIGFDEGTYPHSIPFYSLGSNQTPAVAATKLYSLLRELDRAFIKRAWIDTDFPDTGLWVTLKERIHRALGN